MKSKVIYATRKSALALAQSRAFVAELAKRNPELSFEELQVTTTGDRIQDRQLSEIGGKGLFVKEIEEAMLEGRADIAVHSLKDVPPELAPTLTIGCVPLREDPRDALITHTGCSLRALPERAKLGTSSLRRRVQIAELRPDLEIIPLRGNVDTRLRKCREGEFDAIVLARAGMIRLGREQEATEVLDADLSLPAVGQGALAIECRAADAEMLAILATASHPDTKIAVMAERGVMTAVQGNCQTPVAAYAVRDGADIWLRAMLAEPDGTRLRRAESRTRWPATDAEAHQAGMALGQILKA
jgi:hydroxymethylbilane synthase